MTGRAAQIVPSESLCETISQSTPGDPVFGKLESVSELEAVYAVLEKHQVRDG